MSPQKKLTRETLQPTHMRAIACSIMNARRLHRVGHDRPLPINETRPAAPWMVVRPPKAPQAPRAAGHLLPNSGEF